MLYLVPTYTLELEGYPAAAPTFKPAYNRIRNYLPNLPQCAANPVIISNRRYSVLSSNLGL